MLTLNCPKYNAKAHCRLTQTRFRGSDPSAPVQCEHAFKNDYESTQHLLIILFHEGIYLFSTKRFDQYRILINCD